VGWPCCSWPPAAGGGAGGDDGEGPTAVIGVHTEPEALNPYGPAGEVPIVYELLTATKAPPYVQASDQTWTPRELLNGEAELSADPMTLTYRIHPDATWSDNMPVSARDFRPSCALPALTCSPTCASSATTSRRS
jgi:peptide/nickel transport system substrate-binding protein